MSSVVQVHSLSLQELLTQLQEAQRVGGLPATDELTDQLLT